MNQKDLKRTLAETRGWTERKDAPGNYEHNGAYMTVIDEARALYEEWSKEKARVLELSQENSS